MPYEVRLTDRAHLGLERLKRGGDRGKVKQVHKALDRLEEDPWYRSLETHRRQPGNGGPEWADKHDDLWISWIRKGHCGERIMWVELEPEGDTRVISVEYIGPHLDRR